MPSPPERRVATLSLSELREAKLLELSLEKLLRRARMQKKSPEGLAQAKALYAVYKKLFDSIREAAQRDQRLADALAEMQEEHEAQQQMLKARRQLLQSRVPAAQSKGTLQKALRHAPRRSQQFQARDTAAPPRAHWPQVYEPLGASGPQQRNCVSQGGGVQELQRVLNSFAGAPVPTHGRFCAQTTQKLRRFQLQHKLRATGFLDQPTHLALLQTLAAREQRQDWSQSWLQHCKGHFALGGQGVLLQLILHSLAQQGQDFAQLPGDGPPHFAVTHNFQQIEHHLGVPGHQGFVSEGPEVERLQQFLRARGAELQADGRFALPSFHALQAWQREQGLLDDGYLHGESLAAVNALLAQAAQPYTAFNTLIQRILQDLYTAKKGLSAHFLDVIHQEITLLKMLLLQSSDTLLLAFRSELGPPGRGEAQSRGLEVWLLQKLLNLRGLACPLSAQYDPATAQAVRSLQRALRLPLTGVAERRFLERLVQEQGPVSAATLCRDAPAPQSQPQRGRLASAS